MSRSRKPLRSGFSLTEVLVVIAIIGILASLLMTAICQANGKALRIQCANNVRQLEAALQLFVENNHAYPIEFDPSVTHDSPSQPAFYTDWRHDLAHELGSKDDWRINFFEEGIWKCPSAVRPNHRPPYLKKADYNSYGYNARGLISVATVAAKTNFLGLSSWHSMPMYAVSGSADVSPGEMIALGDGFCGHDDILNGGSLGMGRVYGLPNIFKGDSNEAFSRH